MISMRESHESALPVTCSHGSKDSQLFHSHVFRCEVVEAPEYTK